MMAKDLEKSDPFEKFFHKINEDLVSSGSRDSILQAFAQLVTDGERVMLFYDLPEVQQYDVSPDLDWSRKSAEESVTLRNKGNGLFQKKKNVSALRTYNRSVSCAPVDGDRKELGLALANRSAVLFHMKKFNECNADITKALDCGYPDEMAYKLYDRRGRCFLKLGKPDEAKISFDTATSYLNKAKLDEKKRASWVSDLETQLKSCSLSESGSPAASSKSILKKYKIPSLKVQNEKFPCLSADVGIKQTEARGRFPYAMKDIVIGEVVAIDKPFASVVIPAEVGSHCFECYKYILVSVPCSHCSFVSYCTEECRNASWDRYHSIECSLLPAIYNSEVGLGRLALKTIVLFGLENLRKFNKGVTAPIDSVTGCDKEGVYQNDYNAIYHLVNHSEKRSVADLTRMSAIAVYLTKCLSKTKFFGDNGVCNEHDFILVASHILHNIQMMPCNAHEVSELELDTTSIPTSKKVEIGSGIYATCSLFNHSCDPNVVRHSYGDTCVIRAIRNIIKGEEIVDNYGYLCAMTPKPRRQLRLSKQYFFDCVCTACIEDYPQYLEMDDSMPVFKCVKCSGAVCLNNDGNPNLYLCVNCHHPQDISAKFAVWNQSIIKYGPVMEDIRSSSQINLLKVWIKTLISHLRLLDELVCRPSKEYNECQEALKQCWSIKSNCHLIE